MKNGTPVKKIEILSMDGKIVRILNNFPGGLLTVNREELLSGMYTLRIHADKTYLKWLIVE